MSALFTGTLFTSGWLIDTAAAVTLLIALVLLVRGPVARAFGPGIAYALWLLPLARAVLPGITLTVEVPAGPAAPSLVPLATLQPSPVQSTFDWALLLVIVWLAGALVLSAHALFAYIRLRRTVAADASLIDIIGRIAILQSGAVDGPVALGLIRPLVVLPRDFDAIFNTVQQRQVIAHELEHHRGSDLAINLAAFALLALNWFNPIAWAGWRAFRQDQEAACDARTLDRLGARTGDDLATYGRAIAVAVAGPVFRPTPAFALSMGEKSALIHRLRSLTMTDITPRRRWLGRTALAAAALLALPLTASISYAVVQADPAPPAPLAPAVPPAAPGAPVAPLPPEIDMAAGPGEHIRRIESDGRTIILRTNRQLSDTELERMVAEAEASLPDAERPSAGNADATARRDVQRIVIRTHGQGQSAMPIPPVPPVPPADGERRTERRIMMVHNAAASVRCSGDAGEQIVVRESEDGRPIQLVRCAQPASAALRLQAIRHARETILAMTDAQLPAEARRSALTELDGVIATLERETAE